MSGELLAILEQMAREKGIKKEVLVEAVESALVSAARRALNIKPEEDLRVELDRNTGKIRAFKNNEEITSMDFGRIAASTARQVIIQKIREAEKDVVFTEFQGKVGELVSGTVYRFDKGNIIVDLLGKTEGILPKREQSPKEEFRQGQRICTYVMEVRKETRGPQIILSRIHPSLLKKLFELEVPEIYEGIVEIRSISREPGARSKISVWSKNEKVDSVGACVGMRGNRIRNIVNELQGEKIDIVRYNDDIKEYIKAALSPAQVSEIKLDKENLKAEVIVDDDQLSLAIGKHGQNVRLASRLIGWELDIRTKTTAAGAKEEEKERAKEEPAQAAGPSLENLEGVGEKTASSLIEAGFKNVEDILKAGAEGLMQVKGIGEKKAKKIIEQAKKAKKSM
ncbi:MAG: transcription termination factor NusA [Candidatus Omnitrophica bacterium]|nr:transcription termination factor NusA [Candidatus Omnitrophota bacterium]MDD5553612.1 transcription termination factor NusA [Candidatus Omnitrophota bacterium]